MGILYIVATPIGNLKDITLRALEVLKEVDLVVCEDTRQTIKLLNHYTISRPLVSYFQHSKLSKVEYIFEQLRQGKKVALVTDAGTPGISDPGNKLIEQLLNSVLGEPLALDHPLQPCSAPPVGGASRSPRWSFGEAGRSSLEARPRPSDISQFDFKIVPLPGPNAAIAALSISGFPADKFIFLGFPPHKKGRNKFFDEVANAKYTVVFYESTHRIIKTLNQLKDSLPRAKRLVVCRELTKQFESIYRGTAEEILKILESDKNNLKGEFVIVIH